MKSSGDIKEFKTNELSSTRMGKEELIKPIFFVSNKSWRTLKWSESHKVFLLKNTFTLA